ncbi:MAG: COX15/CtaA family protein [Lewinellaceae bacterium]|nr:COX15/CtaA family protein [Lewinellaceae bacterium]
MEAVANTPPTTNEMKGKRYPSVVKAWLVIGLFMIFMQVVVGGITRLTGSGLSITKWEIVTGTLPPLTAQHWEEAFNMYKATPQYAKINQGMTMSEFKFIYFWEYIHRLWARLMGFVFIIPLAIFWARGMVDRPLLKRLGVVFLLAALVASFGWIMVASGLIERPWVNAYKLTMHLSLALILFSYLLWTTFKTFQPRRPVLHSGLLKKAANAITVVVALQIVLGGIMAGTKAGLFFPTWPDMNGEAIPGILKAGANWSVENLVNYDSSLFMPALIQLLHRSMAYVLTIMVLWFFFKAVRTAPPAPLRIGLYLLVSMLIIQMALGIFTVINSVGMIPVGLGVFHQAGALLLLTITLFVDYQLGKVRN